MRACSQFLQAAVSVQSGKLELRHHTRLNTKADRKRELEHL